MSPEMKKLHSILWSIADELRGNMDASEFKNYMLGLIFYKYLSEKLETMMNDMLRNDNLTFIEAYNIEEYKEGIEQEAISELGYFIVPEYLFDVLANRANQGEFIIEDLGQALKDVEESSVGTDSEQDFAGLFSDVNLQSTRLGATVDEKNKLIAKVLSKLAQIDFKLEDTENDVLGDAYEYLISQFASGAGKKAGEFYTPQYVSEVLARIVTTGKTSVRSVYDPTCGSGSLLLRVMKQSKITPNVSGQEKIQTTYNLARMNMLLHGTKHTAFDIEQGDTLENPKHIDKRFEAIVANPPFSAKWSADKSFLDDERFSNYGKLAPSSKADFAFVQHMIYQLDENGTMAVVLPHGVLFRGSAEGVIRKHLIEDKNYLDAVIGLPQNLFFGTSIPTCILVFKKCRENEDVLFIDASKEFEKEKTQNKLTEEHISKIVETYRNRDELEKYSHKATIEEIKENDYNLNIPRYVDTFEEEKPVDLDVVYKSLRELDNSEKTIIDEVNEYLRELDMELL